MCPVLFSLSSFTPRQHPPPPHKFCYLSSLFPYCIQNDVTSQLYSRSLGLKNPDLYYSRLTCYSVKFMFFIFIQILCTLSLSIKPMPMFQMVTKLKIFIKIIFGTWLQASNFHAFVHTYWLGRWHFLGNFQLINCCPIPGLSFSDL